MEHKQKSIFNLLQDGRNSRYFIGYLICGGVATLVDFALFLSLHQLLGVWYLYANFVSYPVGMLINFSLNKFFNFKNTYKGFLKQFLSFCFVGGIGLAAHQIILYNLVERFQVLPLVGKAMALALVVLWNFFANRYLTFTLMK